MDETTKKIPQNKVAGAVAREIWRTHYLASNPTASKEDIAAAWKGVASEHLKLAKLALKRLAKKKGITLSVS